MGSFKDYINRNNTTATNKTSSSSSFMEYHNKRQKEREEEEERKRIERERRKEFNETKTTTNVLPKANSNFSNLEDLQKEYDKLSLTKQAEMAKQINSKTGLEKLALSSNKSNNTPLVNLDETKLKTEKDLKLDNLKTDAKVIGSNLLSSAKVGGTQLLKSMAMNVDKTQNMYIDAGNQMNEMIIKEMEKEGKDTSHLKQAYREKYDSKPFYQEKIDKLNQEMAKNTEKATNPTSRKIAEISQGLGSNVVGAVATAINPTAGLVYFTGSAKGSYYDEAIQRGMSEEEAENYSGVMALMEGVTERYLAGENIKGFKNILKGQGFKNAVKSFGIEVGENFVQEAVMPSISEVTALATAGKEHLNYDFSTAEGWKNLLADSWSDGVDGALSSIMLNGSTKGVASATRVINKMRNGQTVTQQEIATAVEDSQKAGVDVEGILQEEIKNVAEKKVSQEATMANQNNQTLQNNIDTNIENTQGQINSELNEILNNKELPMQGYKYESSNNAKINNLRQQAGKYFNNSQEAHKFVDMLEKIIVDKDIEIRLDANLKTADGRVANGSYSNGVITINPNSARTGEFIAIHELTHAIGTKSMMNIVENYRKNNAEFNSAVESLLQNYNATELTEEALSDVSAQLFGNQEFINNIANTNPGFFKKIYNEIKYLWHQFRGYKNQNQFVEDLYYKWTQAYNSNNKLNGTNNYSIAGINAVDNIKNNTDLYNQAMSNYNLALNMARQGKNNAEIIEKTGWFKDEKGHWKFEFSDKHMALKNMQYEVGKTYELGKILNHNELFMFYPKLANHKVEFVEEKNSKKKAKYDSESETISINSQLLSKKNAQELIEGTLIHEIQHAIQHIEGFEEGASSFSKLAYYNSLGEIEADNTKTRFIDEKYKNKNISNIVPESSKDNPKHRGLDNYLQNQTMLDKIKDGIYNYIKSNKGEYDYEINQEITSQDKEENNSKMDVGRRINEQENSNKSSFSMDNKGRTLTKEQQEYFKDSKVRDENGNLLEVYHGTKTKGINIFNYDPTRQTGTDYGKAYYFTTDYIKAQGYQYDIEKDPLYIEYSKQDEKWKERVFDTDNEDDRSKLIKEWSNWNKENNVMELLNNEEFTPERLPDGETKKLYLNIKNPYIADAKGQYYFKVYDDYFKEARANGNDGIIVKNVIDVARGEHRPIDVYIAFNENQIKNIDNINPTENPDIRYSISEDTEGRVLSKEQQDFFKDSVVRDEDGNLKIMYHGTDAEFNEFTYENYGKTGTAYGKGFYFTDSKEAGQAYGKNLKEVYLDIKKPMEIGKTTMSKAEFKKLVEAVNKETGGTIEADYGSIEDAVMEYDYGGDDIDLTNGLMSVSGLKTEKFYEILRNTLGYDGIKANNNSNGKDGNYYLAFNSNQIKNIDNINPTGNPDIRHSQNNESWQQHLDKNFKATGTRTNMKDIGINVAPTSKNNVAPSAGNYVQKYNKYKQNIIKGKETQVDNLINFKNETSRNIDQKIAKKQSLLDSKKNQNTKTASILKSQIENLKAQKQSIENLYNEKIDKTNSKINKEKIEFETRNRMKKEAREIIKAELAPLTEDLTKYTDKKSGWKFNRETAQRNIDDIVSDKELADSVKEIVFNPVQKDQANKTREINTIFERINSLGLDKKQKYYYVPKESKTGLKVDEATLAQLLIEKKITDKDLLKYDIDSKGIEKIHNTADTFKEILDDLYVRMNEQQLKYGYSPIGKIENYFPHFTEDKADTMLGKIASYFNIDVSNQSLPTDIAGLTDTFKPGETWNANIQKRRTEKTDYDALTAMERYVLGATEIIHITEDIQRIREYAKQIRYKYSDKAIQEEVDKIINNNELTQEAKDSALEGIFKNVENGLPNFVTWLDDYANTLAGKKAFADRNMERNIGRNMYKSMAGIESRIASNTIGGNVSVSLTNFAPLFQAMGTTKVNYLLTGMLQTTKNNITGIFDGGKDTSFANNSTFLTNRFGTESISRKTFSQKFSDKASALMNMIDEFTAESIVRGKYLENLDSGMTEEQALKSADEYAGKIMADRSKGALPLIFNAKNPLSKLMTMFQVEPNNIVSNYFKDMPRDTKSNAQYVKQVTKLMVASYVFNTLAMTIRGGNEVLPDPIRWVSYLIQMVTGNDDEKEKAKDDLIESLVGSTPFISNLAGFVGMEDIGRIPISNAMPDLTKISSLFDPEVDSKYKKETALKEFSKPFLYLGLPTGGAQLKKTVEGIATVSAGGSYKTNKKGETQLQFPVENANVLDYAKAGVFGKYSLSDSKTYADRGYKALSGKQTKTYKESGIPFAEYTGYIDSKLKKNEDKINYINNTKWNTEQKWGIYKNDILSNSERKDGGSQVSDAEYIIKNGTSKLDYINSYNKLQKNNIDIPTKEEYIEMKEKGVSLKGYTEYKTKVKQETDSKRKSGELTENQELKDKDKLEILINLNYSQKETQGIYESYILKSTNKKYDIIKETFTTGDKLNINKYLKYKLAEANGEFDADRKDDGTVKGEAIRGSAKQKRKDYIENMGTTYTQGIILYGLECTPSNNDKKQIVNYIKSLSSKTNKEKLDMLDQFEWITIYKDGTIEY